MNASFPELSCLSPNNTDDFKHQVYPAAYILIFVLGLAGHALSVCIFFSQWRTQKSFTPVNLLMVNLLVSDLMLVSSLPLRVSYYILNSHWIFGHITCKLISYVYYLNMYSSVYFLVALNILRYLALVRPYMYMRIQRHYVAGIVCALIWLLMGLGCSPLLFTKKKDKDKDSFRCLELAEDNVDQLLLINNVTFPVGFVLPLVVIIFSSVLVARNLLRPSPALGRTRPCRKKACALVIISLGIFLVCFLPYHVVRTIFLITEKQVQKHTYKDSCDYILVVRKAAVIAHCLCTANSCLDPVLFFFVGENSRSVFAKWTGGKKPSACTVGRNLQQEELHVLQN
ncbi:cysteinyl leukotriene receptor 2-like [Carassius carassius]|uniref:cysteinyl leukotriene receptor 2-like n=1 Tax=Carassius carassius TaxID=217509 RepID=UPI00286942A4|nr:cysteinyl leukotriene receptor 2-like [Carassius carassius]